MIIDRVTIRNFRNIEDEKIFNLNPNFTIIIGINGKGKSTVLNAIRIAAGTYLLGIPEVPKRHIWENEIRRKEFESHIVLETPTIIRAEGSIDNQQLLRPWQRQIPEGKTKTTSNAEDVGEIRNIAHNKYILITKEGASDIDNPVIAYFGTGRLYGSSRNTLGAFLGRQIFKYGYYSWSEMQYSTYQYSYWLNSHPFLVADNKDSPETYLAFFDAVRAANPYITAIGFDGKELRLRVKMSEDEPESQFLPLSLHSDGIITHTAMIAELAFRCIMLNAHHKINAVKNSKGVVMIDELDLHLHPNWQRHVVADLKKAFPNIQFVATTHSPFIVQSLKSDEIWNLDKSMDVSPNELKIDTISTEIMGVPSAYSTENEELYLKSKNYLNKLEEGKHTEELSKDIENISDPAVRAFLELRKMSKGK